MRLLKPIVSAMVAAATLLCFTSAAHGGVVFTGKITEIDGRDAGHVQFPKSEAAVSFRPSASNQKSLLVQNYFIHDLTNQKALDIRATRLESGLPAWAYSSITLKNLRIHNIERREDLPGGAGLHIDHIRIAGGGNSQDTKTNVLIENVELKGGDALPILITDGVYGTITIRNVSISDTTLNNIQFKTDKVGSIDKIVIENSPDIGVALIGRPGSVKHVIIKDSEGLRFGDTLSSAGRTGAHVEYLDGSPVPEPTLLAPLGLGMMLLNRRRRA